QLFHTQVMYHCVIYILYKSEDGIRNRNVTGVQTCALPISKALWITTVTVHCIKINQVCKAETGKVLLHYFINMIHSVHVTFVMVSFIDPFTREDIINLTNTNYIVPCCTKTIHISLTNWLQTKVMSISSPGKVIFIGTNIWTGNNPTNSIFW